MGILTEAGRAAMAKAIKEQGLFLALGRGNPDWGNEPPPDDPTRTELLDEIGRRAAQSVIYVTPDEEGSISVPINIVHGGEGEAPIVEYSRYSVSDTPTRHLYLTFSLDYADAYGETVRELGLFVGAVLKDGLPPGKMFFTLGDFDDPGLLFEIENREPITRQVNTREVFSWVISI